MASLVEGKAEFKPTAINGLNKASIKLLKQYATKGSDFNMIEVMCCEGGCVAGPGCVALAKKSAIMVETMSRPRPTSKTSRTDEALPVTANGIAVLNKKIRPPAVQS